MGLSLVEVMIASTLALGITVTSVASVVYYQKTVYKNDRAAKVANLLEGQMERLLNQSWEALANQTNGLFPPGGPSGGTNRYVWMGPTETGKFIRYKSGLSTTLVSDSNLSPEFAGLSGIVDVYYTPFVWTHVADAKDGSKAAFDVKYYKVEVVLTLDETSRISPPNGTPEVWTTVCYITELGGRTETLFSNNILSTLRDRQRPL